MPRRSTAITDVSFGLDYTRPPLIMPDGALLDGLNFRVRHHALTNDKVGWLRTSWPALDGPVMLIETHRARTGLQKTVFATFKDLYKVGSASSVLYITPRYNVGTVDVSAANPAVVTVNTGVPNWITTGIKAGDQIHFGNATQDSTTATWYTINTVNTESQLTLSAAVTGAPLTNQAYTIRRLFTGDSKNIWSAVMWIDTGGASDYMYFTNGKDAIVRWDGVSTAATYSAATFKARSLAVYSNMLIFGNLTQSGSELPGDIINSAPGNPENTTSGLASQFKVHDAIDTILYMRPLGDNLVIYSGPDPGNVVLAQFVGDPLVFVFRKAVSDVGPISARAVADQGDYHEFLGSDAGYKFDGSGLQVNGKQVWQKHLGNRDPSRQHLAFHNLVPEFNELIWALPLPEDTIVSPVAVPQTAFVEHYMEQDVPGRPNPFSRRDFPFLSRGFEANTTTKSWDDTAGSWDSNSNAWNDSSLLEAYPQTIVGDHLGKTYFLYQSHKADGALLASFVRFGRRPLGNGVNRGLIQRIYAFAKELVVASSSLDVVLRLCDNAHGSPAVTTSAFPLDLSLPEGKFFVSPFRRARFAEVEFQMNQAAGVWELAGYDWKLGESEGER